MTEPEESEEKPKEREPVDPIKGAVAMFYDLQQIRIATGNRAIGRDDDSLYGLAMAALSQSLLEHERNMLKVIKLESSDFPVHVWLNKQVGCGPTMTGALLSAVDITKSSTPSALWKYCGLGVTDGKADGRAKGKKLDYNPWIKTKLVGVLAGCMMRAGSPWRQHYDERKAKRVADGWGKSDLHRHRDATRFMMKKFLTELWIEWRHAEQLPITPTYLERLQISGVAHGDHGVPGFAAKNVKAIAAKKRRDEAKKVQVLPVKKKRARKKATTKKAATKKEKPCSS